jgi:hypothetical protein
MAAGWAFLVPCGIYFAANLRQKSESAVVESR